MTTEHDYAYVVCQKTRNEYEEGEGTGILGVFYTIEEAEKCLVTHLPDRFFDYHDERFFLRKKDVDELKTFIDLSKLRRAKFIEHEDGSGSFDDEWIAYGDKDPLLTDEQKVRLHKMFGIRETNSYSERFEIVKCILVPTEVIK
jgi:hypothetical protein